MATVNLSHYQTKSARRTTLPTWLLEYAIDTIAPFLTKLLAASLESGEFPQPWKHAIIRPHLKRPGLNPMEASNYRPVANLLFMSKLLEMVANRQLVDYLARNGLMLKHQAAYCAGHSTETALLRITMS